MPSLRFSSRLAALAACACAASGISRPNDPPATINATPLAIVDVQVVSMHSAVVAAHQTVLIRDGRIEWVGPVGARTPPPDATVIQGGGRFLMPALIDMHVHLRAAELELYLANGIATVRNMWGFPEVARWAEEIASGTRLGPTIFSASQGLDGTPPQWPLTVLVTPESARAAVQGQRDAGWSWLKVYTRLTPAAFDSVMAAARDLRMIPIGHVPFAVDIRTALAAGMKSIEHLTGYDRAVSRSGNAGTWAWIETDPSRYADRFCDAIEDRRVPDRGGCLGRGGSMELPDARDLLRAGAAAAYPRRARGHPPEPPDLRQAAGRRRSPAPARHRCGHRHRPGRYRDSR